MIQIFNIGAERMLGYAAVEVVDRITPGFEALVFKASRGIEDIYELTYIRKDGSRFPAVVSVTALRDAQDAIIGYLLIGTDNTARKQIEAEQKKLDQRLRDQQFYTRSLVESNIDALMTTERVGVRRVLAKPSEPQVIIAAVAEALGELAPATRTAPPEASGPPRLDAMAYGKGVAAQLDSVRSLDLRLAQLLGNAIHVAEEQAESPTAMKALKDVLQNVQSLSLRLTGLVALGIDLAAARDPRELIDLFWRAR